MKNITKLKVLIISIVIIMAGIFFFVMNTIVIIDGNFSLTKQNLRFRELPPELKVNARILPLGKQNALVLGSLELHGKRYAFQMLSTNNSNGVDERIYQLSCETNLTITEQIDTIIFIKLKGRTVEELELIEAVTSYKNNKTESENGIYSIE